MKGQILKIKTGYNPNSSSIGADMIMFFTTGAAVLVLFNAIAAILTAQTAQRNAQQKELKELPVLSRQEDRR
jgi:hypothetical protein